MYGFVQTPYRKVDCEQVLLRTKSFGWADEEDEYTM